MKTKVSEPEIKVKEYLDKENNEEKHIGESEGRLDLNVLLKRLKDEKNSDKKLNFLLTGILTVVLFLVLVFLI
jgi:hypothetical protein